MSDDATITKQHTATRLELDHLEPVEIEAFRRAGTIIADPRRRRPRYFDGRFLAAPDLAREQDYFLGRQAELTRAAGAGVLHGLLVERVDDIRVQVTRGNGITPAGDLVVLSEPLVVDLGEVAAIQQLDRDFGLDVIPNEPPRRRTGLFVLAIRPVEFSANPIAAYPASVAERRTVDDGEIIEAVALTLIPYRDDHVELDPQQQRGEVARRIFLERAEIGLPVEALPIAMLQLDRGFTLWVDPWLVRREIGAEHAGVSGFALTPRAVREAHVHQQKLQLQQVLDERRAKALDDRFAAGSVFRALPPAGLLPSGAIQRAAELDFRQAYFPSGLRVAISLVPRDELAVLVDEALMLPPVDLAATSDDLEFTALLVLVALERDHVTELRRQLADTIQSVIAEKAPTLDPPLDAAAQIALLRSEQQRLFTLELLPAAPQLSARGNPTDALIRSLPGTPSALARRSQLRLRSAAESGAGLFASRNRRAPAVAAPAEPPSPALRASGAAAAPELEPPGFANEYEPEADAIWTEVLADLREQVPVYWYVRRRMLRVAPDAVALRDLNFTEE